MSEFRDLLERERQRFTFPEGSVTDLERRRERKRRNRRVASALVALIVAAAGVGGGLYAVRMTGTTKPANPGPTLTAPASPGPSVTPPIEAVGAPRISGPIQFVDDQRGWMVDALGQILATRDGGHTWEIQTVGPSTSGAIDMLDGRLGWAVFDGMLLQTSDGGAHWVILSNRSLSSIQFLTPETGWGVVALRDRPVGLLAKTEDGGRTWTRQGLEVSSVCFADEKLGWAAGPSEGGVSLFRTDDGGSNWNEMGIGLEGGDYVGYQATVRCGGIDAWVLVTGGASAGHIAYALFRTGEGGPSVAPVLQDGYTHLLGKDRGIPESTNPYPGPLAAFDGVRASLATWCPACGGDTPFVSLEGTTDGGTRWSDWTVVGSDRPSEPVGISFLDQDRGWMLLRDLQTKSDIVLKTSDAGESWERP